jgi:hypothetical protein
MNFLFKLEEKDLYIAEDLIISSGPNAPRHEDDDLHKERQVMLSYTREDLQR